MIPRSIKQDAISENEQNKKTATVVYSASGQIASVSIGYHTAFCLLLFGVHMDVIENLQVAGAPLREFM